MILCIMFYWFTVAVAFNMLCYVLFPTEEDEGETEGTAIFVKNLSFNTTEEKMKEVFFC